MYKKMVRTDVEPFAGLIGAEVVFFCMECLHQSVDGVGDLFLADNAENGYLVRRPRGGKVRTCGCCLPG